MWLRQLAEELHAAEEVAQDQVGDDRQEHQRRLADDRRPLAEHDAPGAETGEHHQVDRVLLDLDRDGRDAAQRLDDQHGEGVEAEDDPGDDFAGAAGGGASWRPPRR